MIETDFKYNYSYPSTFSKVDTGNALVLSHCSEIEEEQKVNCYFYGNIKNSFVLSRCLSSLARTVSSHFSLAPGQLIYLRDPIVSVGNQEIRFEAFSSCNSVYTRIDVLNSSIDGEFLNSGCTNIDFNDNTIRALNSVSQSENLLLGIGEKEVHIITEKSQTIEKKVTLPNRWIKGLGNVQVYLSEMELVFTLSKVETIQLFKSLPKVHIKEFYFLSKSGVSFQFSPTPKPNSVCIGGIHRLNLLQTLILSITNLLVYKNENEQSVAFVLVFKDIQMTFLFSASVYRGFSGEGRNLESLIENVPKEWILELNSFFKTNETFNPTLVAIENDIEFKTMDGLQSSLSSIGLLGFNLFENNYFYRKLPFKLDRLLKFNPRLQNAHKLLERGEVIIIDRKSNYLKAEVKGSSDVIHTVIMKNNDYQCTCTWHTNNKNNRGLCKHILAVKLKT